MQQLSAQEIEIGQALGLIPRHLNTRIALIKGLIVTLIISQGYRHYKYDFQSSTISDSAARFAAKQHAKECGLVVRCIHSVTNPEA